MKHAFSFTLSISLFVECESEAEFDMAFGKLATDGVVLMPVDNYGFSRKFGLTSRLTFHQINVRSE